MINNKKDNNQNQILHKGNLMINKKILRIICLLKIKVFRKVRKCNKLLVKVSTYTHKIAI